MNKRKIINDPIYGFVSIPSDFIFELIEHPWFQRLRHIRQLGLTYLVYPGALHTRFHHALGAMHLVSSAIDVLKNKGHEISEKEAEGVLIAILLHDIGHGPFSHALEHSLVSNVHHESLSNLIMQRLNHEFNNRLDLALQIFNNSYHKKFLHQLVSGQLDMDRLDYLRRDSFYTGVSEGVVSSDRIISMLNVANDSLVIEGKGIYSIEKFIVARRLMYWQVYLHKTVLVAENMLVMILKRARELAFTGKQLFTTPALHYFLYKQVSESDFKEGNKALDLFLQLDDSDLFTAIKQWQADSDKVLALLCQSLLNRKLFKIELRNQPFTAAELEAEIKKVQDTLGLTAPEASYFVFTHQVQNNAYKGDSDKINIQFKNGEVKDIADAADNLNISALTMPVTKFFLCYPKY